MFFSNLIRIPVINKSGRKIGQVVDVFIKNQASENFPPVAGLVVRNQKTKEIGFVPDTLVRAWEHNRLYLKEDIDLAKSPLPKEDGMISMVKSVLDKQIVDLDGLRVVRVNDLQFGLIQEKICLVAIDVSTRGLLRRMGLRNPMLDKIAKSQFLEWRNVKIGENKLQLSTGAQDLVKLHPADIANIIEKMNITQGSILLQSLDQATAARVLEEIQPQLKKIFVSSLGSTRAASVMSKMSVDELVDLIQLLPRQDSYEIISKLPINSKLLKVKKFLEYDEDTAGGLMTTPNLVASPETTVEEMVAEIKKISPELSSIHYVYITNGEGKFLGIVSMRRLIVAEKNQKMKELMKRGKIVRTVRVNQSLTAIAAIMTKYNLSSVAVLDREGKLLGVVTVDDIMRRFMPEA